MSNNEFNYSNALYAAAAAIEDHGIPAGAIVAEGMTKTTCAKMVREIANLMSGLTLGLYEIPEHILMVKAPDELATCQVCAREQHDSDAAWVVFYSVNRIIPMCNPCKAAFCIGIDFSSENAPVIYGLRNFFNIAASLGVHILQE